MSSSSSMITEDKMATKIQSFWRGHKARKQFSFHPAPAHYFTDETTMVVGNDPKIEGLAAYASPHGKTAMIGTSGLRSLALICELGNQEHTPKLIIVDFSKMVLKFWRSLRDRVAEKHYASKQEFIIDFKHFLKENHSLWSAIKSQHYMPFNTNTLTYENQNPLVFMNRLISKHGLDMILAIIKNTTIIAHSWTDRSLFKALKNILDYNGIESIYLYPSNIASCILPRCSLDIQHIDNLFKNVQTISPRLSIFTDRPASGIPKKVILSTESSAVENKKKVFEQPPAVSPTKPTPGHLGGFQQHMIDSIRAYGGFDITVENNVIFASMRLG